MSSPEPRDARAHERALALLAVCGLCWSTAGVLFKLVSWNSGAIWSVRSAVCTLVLVAVRPRLLRLRRISRTEWLAALSLASTTGLFILSNKLTTAANAILIQYSAPIWVAVFGTWLLGERATRLDWLTIVAMLGGITLFFFEQLTFDHVAGNLCAVAAGISYALSAMGFRKVALASGGAPADPLRPLFLGSLLGAVLGAPWILTGPSPDLTGWAALLALGVVQQAVAYLCYARAIRHATALEALLIPVIEPV
ncbi:MAG TPA: DMT family transporter, partial [Kofleriaceae bacterium]